MTNNDVAFTATPVFVGWITILLQLPIQLFLTFWAGGFFGGITSSLPVFERGSWAPFLFFGGIAFFGIPAVAYFGKKLNYSRTEYRFFHNRLEFEEGFFSINKKVIKYRDVKGSHPSQRHPSTHLRTRPDIFSNSRNRIERDC